MHLDGKTAGLGKWTTPRLNWTRCRPPIRRPLKNGREEELASVNHEIADVDKWEQAHFTEDDIRNKVKAAKKRYEDALREKFFGF